MSSGRRGLALLLCAALTVEGAGTAAAAAPVAAAESCLLLKYSAPSISEGSARERMAPMPDLLLRDLEVRWVTLPAAGQEPQGKDLFPEADDASLERISARMAEALRRMERMETREAASLLAEAEGEARRFRLTGATRPFFAEIFLRRGLLKLWEGDRGKAEELFARSRVLQPDFSPDPGLFSPAFREAWNRAGERPPPEADLLIQSIPPGASVYLDGNRVGTTPGRVKVPVSRPVRIRLALQGYQDMEREGQWIPGDSESIESVLVRDRIATLGDLLTASPEGKGTGPLLAEMAAGAGAARTALMVLEGRDGRSFVSVFSFSGGDTDPVFLGRFEWPEGAQGAGEAAGRTARMLREAGWPAKKEPSGGGEAPWYHKWWVYLLVGAVVIGVAAGAGAGGGGGGSSGSSTGGIGVAF
jgi:hypothetical protein